jgi:type II secretory pathway component PulK
MSQRHKKAAKRHPSRRRLLGDLGLVVLVVGCLCLVISAVMAGAASFLYTTANKRMLNLAGLYGGVGLLLLLIRGLVLFLRNRLTQTQKYPTGDRKRRAPAPLAPPVSPPPEPTPPPSGSVLILTLVLLALVTALVLQTQIASRLALQRTQAIVRSTQLELAAADALRGMMQELAADEDLRADHTNKPWATPREYTTPSGIAVRVSVVDENRYFDLNNLAVPVTGQPLRTPPEMLLDILTQCGDFDGVQRVDALTDWVDANAEGFREDDFYREQAALFRPPHRPLRSGGELLRVAGFSRELFARHDRRSRREAFQADLVDCVTVIGVDRTRPIPVNINTAGREVLIGVLGFPHESLVDNLLAQRKARPFRSLEQLALLLDPLFMDSVASTLDVKSRYFRIDARVYSEGQARDARAVVVRGENGGVKPLQWIL